MKTPRTLDPSEITMVVPVKNNQTGVERLLQACLRVFSPPHCPAEILLIDNLSYPPLQLPSCYRTWGLPIRVLVCTRPGAAAARNLGARQAKTPWVLFVDSDCRPTAGWIDGFRQALDGSVAYAGVVRAASQDGLSRYYESQAILHPTPLWTDGEERPAFVITANTLIWREALAQIGGFDERFPSAAGEDIDLGVRLWEVGTLAQAPSAQVAHHFEQHLGAFLQRFMRYGRGNRYLAARYRLDLSPHPFAPVHRSWCNEVLAWLQYAAMWWGYHTTRPHASWASPSPLPPWSSTPPEPQSTFFQEPISPLPVRADEVIVVIDGDCISPKWISEVTSQMAALGPVRNGWVFHTQPTARRAWEQVQVDWSLTIEQGDPDSRAMKWVKHLLRTTSHRTFCLVSNDKDWAQIAQVVHQAGGTVWGMGAANASRIFQEACKAFHPFSATIKPVQEQDQDDLVPLS